MNGTKSRQPAVTTPDAPGMLDETGRSDQVHMPPAASAPQTFGTALAGAGAPPGTTLSSVGIPEPVAADRPVTSAVDANSAPGMTGDANTAGGTPVQLATGSFVAVVGADMAHDMPVPPATGPFVAVVRAAEGRRPLPPLVVGEQIDEGLTLARTLLAARLPAVSDSALEYPLFPAAAGVVAAQETETTGAGMAVPVVEVCRSVGSEADGTNSIGLGGAATSIAELLKGLPGPECSGEHRRA
ncbi:hypothetical protein OH799_00985 [Nocardia sp. NBC_00881]|uniref:hypothetical protein n=1 Tax=Nocardia sp. NBC_00881 TaxID=2975995 RepID=UPI003869469B|nr:hypothetical protein OH799_00985 [Nocardia sp. NBC_00881]